jgi:O-antigen/teichoic acid export membrane protein
MNVRILRKMFSYGGWITITNIISPLLVYMDRLIIGSLISMSAVTFYAIPYELVARVKALPNALMTTAFPEFSAAAGNSNDGRIRMLVCRSVKYILASVGLLSILLFVYAPDILDIWLGPDFKEKSAVVFRILVVGVFINSLSFIPFNLLQGIGRPDLPAKFHLMELPMYLALMWVLIAKLGITGAALGWTIRVFLDAVLLYSAALRIRPIAREAVSENKIVHVIVLLVIHFVLVVAIVNNRIALSLEAFLLLLVILMFSVLVWVFIFDDTEKQFVVSRVDALFEKCRA